MGRGRPHKMALQTVSLAEFQGFPDKQQAAMMGKVKKGTKEKGNDADSESTLKEV